MRGAGARAAGAAGAAGGAVGAGRACDEVGSAPVQRMSTGIGELDRVLGGGLVPGLAGAAGRLAGDRQVDAHEHGARPPAPAGHSTLYVSGEESAEQVRLRAERLAGDPREAPAPALEVPILAETDLDVVLATLAAERPAGLRDRLGADAALRRAVRRAGLGRPGARGRRARSWSWPRRRASAVILVGHVTKDGALAGPRVLEHLVDCVLQFEGERERPYRELRALKNRFGSTNEAGLFEMRQGGLVEVLDASARFVAEATRAPGSVVLAAMEGSRPLLVEVQALVAPSELEQPRRVVSGLDRNRLALVLAILGRHGRLGTGAADVFVNVVGGVRVDEPGCDLAVALAVASAEPRRAARRDPPAQPAACFGELGLTGELRWVGHPERRLEEAAKYGLCDVIAPPTAARSGTRGGDAARGARPRALPGRPGASRDARRGVPPEDRCARRASAGAL